MALQFCHQISVTPNSTNEFANTSNCSHQLNEKQIVKLLAGKKIDHKVKSECAVFMSELVQQFHTLAANKNEKSQITADADYFEKAASLDESSYSAFEWLKSSVTESQKNYFNIERPIGTSETVILTLFKCTDKQALGNHFNATLRISVHHQAERPVSEEFTPHHAKESEDASSMPKSKSYNDLLHPSAEQTHQIEGRQLFHGADTDATGFGLLAAVTGTPKKSTSCSLLPHASKVISKKPTQT